MRKLLISLSVLALVPRRPPPRPAAAATQRHDALASSRTRSRRSSSRSSSPPTRRRPAGQGVKFQTLVRRLRGAEQGGRRRPARRRRQLLDLDRHGPARAGRARRQDAGTRTRTTASSPSRSSSSCSATATRSTSRRGTTSSSRASQVVFPNPFSSGGARWDVMAAYGAQLREHKTPKQAQAYLDAALPAQRLAGHERAQRAEHVPVGQGRRAARLRERREARAVAGQARLLPDPEGDAADRDAARRRQRLEQGRGEAVRQLAVHAGGADDLGAERLPLRSSRASRRSSSRSSRRGRSCSRSATSAAGTR